MGFDYSGLRVDEKPWWQDMKHDWTADQWNNVVCRRCDVRVKSKHEGEQHECAEKIQEQESCEVGWSSGSG